MRTQHEKRGCIAACVDRKGEDAPIPPQRHSTRWCIRICGIWVFGLGVTLALLTAGAAAARDGLVVAQADPAAGDLFAEEDDTLDFLEEDDSDLFGKEEPETETGEEEVGTQSGPPTIESDPQGELDARPDAVAPAIPVADDQVEGESETVTPSSTSRPPQTRGGIERIVVLGTLTEGSEDFETADSVTAFDADDLAALGVQSIADLASYTPNLEIVTAGATTPTFFIRGVGLNDFNPNSTGAVAIYQDDVAINAPAIQLGTLYDVESVSVLRGPQGTGLARNASAGAIKVRSRKPSGNFGGYVRADFGNFDFHEYEGAVEAPLFQDMLASRFAFRLTRRDGTMRNRCGNAPPPGARVPYPGSGAGVPVEMPWSICGEPVENLMVSNIPTGLEKDVNDIDNWAARGSLRFEPNLDASFLLNFHGSRRDELSRLGQAIGTGGNFCVNGDICSAPFAGVPPSVRGRPSSGVLGGTINGTSFGANYSPREVLKRLGRAEPCLVATTFSESCAAQPLDVRISSNRAKKRVARELAADLDSDPWVGDFNHTGPTTNDTWGGYLRGEILLPFDIDLTTVTAYDTYERLTDIDLDFSPETLFQIRTEDEAWQVYQDLKLEGDFELGQIPVFWEAGGWLLREELDVKVNNNFGALQATGVLAREYSQESWSAAGFGYVSIDLLDDFTLDGGFRYGWDQKELEMDIVAIGAANLGDCIAIDVANLRCRLDESWKATTGTVRLTYRFYDDTHLFAKYTRGWKPGSFNATASQFTGPTVADAEEIDSYEIGVHGSWFDTRLTADAQAFYYAYDSYQIFTAQQFLGGTPEFVLLNANDAEVYGAEIEASVNPWEGGIGTVRFSWLESQFLDFVRTDQFLASQGGADLVVFRDTQNSGNPLLNSPRFKVSITAEQTVHLDRFGSVTGRYDGVWSDTTYFDPTRGRGLGNQAGQQFLPDDTIAQKPYWLHNFRLSWRDPDELFEVAGWVRNITDESYKTFAFDGSNFRKTTIYYVNDPRTFGGSVTFNF